jgi:serine/threonine protein kinase
MVHPNDASKTDDLIGPTAFGKYTIFARLGSGGMADALLAMLHGDLGFQKLVVLKRMHSSLGRDSHFVRMFLDEARLAARLNHPNVVATSEVGEVDGHYFIAMEYLEGLSLDRIVRKYIKLGGGIPLGFLFRVLCDSLEGLHYAHELRDFGGQPLGVVHRDVTPSNLFVTSDGMAKVLDFGIAKAATQDEATRTGMLKGKLAYMSPEQFYSDPVDRRADLWSMGVLIWEMVTGRRLFKGTNDAVTYQNIVTMQIPSVTEFRPDAPPEIDQVLHFALQRERDERYQDAESMRRDMERILHDSLGSFSRADVGSLMRVTFGEVLEENRETIRAFATPSPQRPNAPFGLNSSGELRPGGGMTVPPSSAQVDPRSLGISPSQGAAVPQAGRGAKLQAKTLLDPPDPVSDAVTLMEPAPSTMRAIDIDTQTDVGRMPDPFASVPPEVMPGSVPLPRQHPTAMMGTPRAPDLQTAPTPGPVQSVNIPATVAVPPSMLPTPAAPAAAPQPSWPPGAVPPALAGPPMPRVAGLEPVAPRDPFPQQQRPTVMLPPKQGKLETVLGWALLMVVVAVISAFVYSRWDWIRSAGGALLRNEPAPAAYVGTFRLRITSEPNHATVYENDVEIGATPFELVIHRAQVVQHPRQFVLRATGRQAVAVVQSNTLQPETRVHVALPAAAPRR